MNPDFKMKILILLMAFLDFTFSAPAFCHSCRGNCSGGNKIALLNITETDFLDSLVDNETGKLLNLTITNDTEYYDEIEIMYKNRIKRHEYYIEKRTCSSQFQLELFMIPISISMIPIALVSLLLCVCFCGPKDSRGQIPEKMMGIRFSQKRKISDNNNFSKPKITVTSSNSDEELEYKDGYVQRKDSKKTRFATDIKFIEPIRRSSSVSCLENYNSRRNSYISNDSGESNQFQTLKKTRFSDSVSVLGENSESIPSKNQPKRKLALVQRSISVT